ncbi:hypothetical protein [Nitrospira moscoviensis]|uniref:EfeO-type cupredoxin-like domain-containing protein n=1 Tax=Nitrospira moscoviensis TaxID=42253 RepID=A0A0K2GEQ5_NITMO|nr:hypothetical protein [Nitrospira moscoviensis]ALA59428.1 exported protein of unknown function [Nitrospira moscoviensis]
MHNWTSLKMQVGLALLVGAATLSAGVASARDVTFIAQELAKDRAIWQPGMVMMDQRQDLKEPLFFVLENPTGTEHEFAVGGLFMILSDEEMGSLRTDIFTGPVTGQVLAPIRVKVKARETLKIRVSPVGLEGAKNLGARYPFFCPTHKDLHLGGFILVE